MVVVFSRDYYKNYHKRITAIVTANGQTNIAMLELLTNSSTMLNNKIRQSTYRTIITKAFITALVSTN